MLASGARGGPLDPPAPLGSTDGVRLPRYAHFRPNDDLPEPGHYYLTNDVTVTGSQNAITIASSRVSLDLGGFHVVGGDGPE